MLNKKLFIYITLLACLLPVRLSAQDTMTSLKPSENKLYDAMTGNWSNDGKMMGIAMHQEMNVRWALNHQYIIMDLTAAGKDNPNVVYSGMGVFGVDEKGNAKLWWFGDGNASYVSTGNGTFGDNMLTMTDGNAILNESRTFKVKGSQMIIHRKGIMKIIEKDVTYEETMIFIKK